MSILIVTGIEGARNCADAIEKQLGLQVEVTEGRRGALSALLRKDFAVVVVDESLVECDPAAADAIWERAGLAIPVQVNFALSGAARVIREIRAALQRRAREQTLAHRAAAEALESEVRSTLAGLLLQSQLVLNEQKLPHPVVDKLRLVADLATNLRKQLGEMPAIKGQPAA